MYKTTAAKRIQGLLNLAVRTVKYEGCPILRQIYAWHCIVFTSHNNTVQKHDNKE